MGLIRAALDSAKSTLHDTWLDAVKCEDFDNSTLMVKKTTDNGVISKGSRIIVNPGQVAIIVDNGKVLDAAAQPGPYTFDDSTSPSFFSGDFGGVFAEMAERFSYGGKVGREQAVYFINSKEIIGNKFGTPAPVPYKDWGHPNFNPRNNSMYPMAVNIKAFGTFTFKISDPFRFMNQIGGTAQRYTKDMLEQQIKSEFIAAFKNTLAELGSDKYRIEAMDLPHKDDEIVAAMCEKKYDAKIADRGITIVSVAVESIKFDEDSDKKIRDYELSDAYTQSGYMAGATGRAMEEAAKNPNGSMTGFMGVGMAQSAGNANNMLNSMMAAQQNAQAAQIQGADAGGTWDCKCSEKNNKNKFCASCGSPKPTGTGEWDCNCGKKGNKGKYCEQCGKERPVNKLSDGTWLCSCGTENKGKFCENCGLKSPSGAVCYKCDKCGWEPSDKSNPPKFCAECGDKFDENDIVK